MSAVLQFHQLTNELIQLLKTAELDRDDKVTRTEELLNQREALMNAIVPPYSPEEMEAGKEINQLNMQLFKLLIAEKASVQRDIKGLQSKKESNTKYVNPYQSLATDGMFYDQRK